MIKQDSPTLAPSLVLPPQPTTLPVATSSSLSTKLVNGAIAGVVGTSIIFPIDMVKTRLQNQRPLADGRMPYSGGWDCFRKMVANGGFRSLYRGLVPNLIGVTPEKAIKLAVNDLTRERLGTRLGVAPDNLPIKYGMLAGATAGFCQVIATNPMEIVKIRMQVATQSTNAILIARELGIRGLYRGTPATLLRDVPFSIMFFPGHAFLKTQLAKYSPDGQVSFLGVFGSGVVAGGIAAAAVTPSDVVKTRLQVASTKGGPTRYWPCLKQIVAEEGPSALFRGAIPRAMIVAPLFGIALLTYELQQKLMADRSASNH